MLVPLRKENVNQKSARARALLEGPKLIHEFADRETDLLGEYATHLLS